MRTMEGIFEGTSGALMISESNIGDWDVSKVTSFVGSFSGSSTRSALLHVNRSRDLDLSHWSVISVASGGFNNMFGSKTEFESYNA